MARKLFLRIAVFAGIVTLVAVGVIAFLASVSVSVVAFGAAKLSEWTAAGITKLEKVGGSASWE